MPRLKITQAGFTTLTGVLHTIAFTNGLSGILTDLEIKRVAANIACDLYQNDGTTRIGVAGEAAGIISLPRAGAQPNRAAGEQPRIDLASQLFATVEDATYTLVAADHTKLITFTGACVITVPADLPLTFRCKLRQGGADQISVEAADGVDLVEASDQFLSEKQFVILELIGFPDGTYQLTGLTAASVE